MKLSCTRIQHPVGHGGFHTGELCIDGCSFRYIYDCGSTRQAYINEHVESYAANIKQGSGKPSVDALFVSHFHQDHIKGLATLFEKVTVKKVIIPYITSWDWLWLWTAAKSKTGRVVKEYWSFLKDPHGWFTGKGVEVIYVSIPSGETGQDSDPQYINNNSPSIQPAMVLSGIHDPLANEGITTHFDHRQHLQVRMPGVANVCWVLMTYVQKDDAAMSKFKNCVSKQFDISATDDKAGLDICKHLASDCREEGHVEKLKDCYLETLKKRTKNGNLNPTSMSLYSGPCKPRKVQMTVKNKTAARMAKCKRQGWLLTGDAQLKSKDARKSFLKHYSTSKEQVGILSFPHHGSKLNFHHELLDGIGAPISSVAARHKSTHPHKSVMKAAIERGVLFITNESDDSKLVCELETEV